MKKILLITLTLFLISCKKEDIENQPNSINNCKEDSYAGTWEFVINKDKANEYKDTIILVWNGSTYIINNLTSQRTDLAARLVYRTESEQVDIWKDNCNLKYKGSFDGRKL